jgi:hypothetical protein
VSPCEELGMGNRYGIVSVSSIGETYVVRYGRESKPWLSLSSLV